MCDNPKNIWTPDNYNEDQENVPRGLYRADLAAEDYEEPKEVEFVGTTQEPAKIARAILAGKPPNLIGSKIHDNRFRRSDYHAPLFDFDGPMRVKKSSTRGHYHVLLDGYVGDLQYKEAITKMAEAGMLQWGFANNVEKYGQTFLRWNCLKDNDA